MSSLEVTPSHSVYIFIYSFIFLCFGLLSGSLGPVIPYLAKESGLPQTSYSFLFIARSLGSILGFIIFKWIQKQHFHRVGHKIIFFHVLVDIVFLNIFSTIRSPFWEFLTLVCMGTSRYCVLTATNICLIGIGGNKAGSWLIFVNAIFGVGALLSPILIRIFELNYYQLLSLCYLSFSLLCRWFQTPAKDEDDKKDKIADGTHGQCSSKVVVLLSLSLFLMSGIQSTITGWFPSYAVKAAGQTKSQATVYGSLFWGSNTLFRFINASMTSISGKLKLNVLISCILAISIMCCVLNSYGYHSQTIMFGSVFFGISCSAVYPLFIAIFKEYNLRMRPEQTANMMFVPILATMCITGPTGMLMKMNLSLLFVMLAVLAGVLWLVWMYESRLMAQEELKVKKKQIEKTKLQ